MSHQQVFIFSCVLKHFRIGAQGGNVKSRRAENNLLDLFMIKLFIEL